MSVRPSRRALRPALLLAAVLVGLLPANVDAATVTVHVGSSLNPKTLTIAPGTAVRWVNGSNERHRVRSRTGPVEFDSGNIEPGESYSFTFTRSGTYPYLDDRDRDDPNFHGTIVVAASADGSSGGSVGGSAPSPSAGGGAAPASVAIHVAGRAFGPSSVTIAAGGSVTFVNDDDREHTATGDGFDTGVLSPGAQSQKAFASAGTFSFLCQIHPDMRGTINVRGSADAAPAPAAPAPTARLTPVPPVGPVTQQAGSKAASIVDFAFEPHEMEILAGATITWQNRGAAPHTVTSNDDSFDSGLIESGATFAQTFDAPGRYRFACAFHPEMVGTVVVTTAANGASPGTASPPASPSTSAPPTAPPPGQVAGHGVPPDAAGPTDSQPVSALISDGLFRLLLVAGLIAVSVMAFGVLIAGTARNGRAPRSH